jgi:alpha-beta hydrolase superfamily lysophospholipase
MTLFNLKSQTDDLPLHGQLFAPDCDAQDCRAVISLIHGYSEHGARYADMGRALNEAGIALITIDLRGHGRSGGKRGVIKSYPDFYGDVDALLTEARRRFPDVPHFAMGHSMGGGILFNYRHERDLPQIMGYIITAPLLRLAKPAPEILRPLMLALRKLFPSFTLSQKVSGKDISTIASEAEAYANDPLVHGQLSPALALDMIDYGELALGRAKDWQGPLLLMHGEADAVTDLQASLAFKAQAGDAVTLKSFEGAYHEIHNDICRDDVYREIINFITHHIKARGLT